MSLDFATASPAFVVRTSGGETRIPFANGSWAKSRGGFVGGVERFLGVPSPPLLAAAGAWAARDTFVVKLVAYETPFYTILMLRFDADQLVFDSEHNVSLGQTKQPQLIGVAAGF